MEIKLISCPLCAESNFHNVTILRNALINVTKKPLNCPICQEVIYGLDKFTIHLFTHCDIINEDDKTIENNVVSTNDTNNNNNDETHKCNGTEMSITKPEEVTTSKIHCEICNFDFTDENMLELHKTLLHSHSNGFSCHLCSKKFKMHGSLMVHMRVAHFGFKNKLITDKTTSSSSSSQSIIPINNNKNENLSTQQHIPKVIDNKQWECDVCLKKFTTKYFLKKHKRLHTGEMPYECTLCNKSFTFQQSYHKHMLYHSAEKPHTCSECGRAFKELSTLHNHQRIHSGERPFACETCGKRFRQRVSYLVHKRIHTGAMPYKCTACDKSFRYKVSQRTHKCKAQPPGSVVRQFGDLVQKLLQNRPTEEIDGQNIAASNSPSTSTNTNTNNITNTNPSISSISDISNDKSTESCPEVGNTDFFGLVMSPTFQITSDQFESLCLTNKDDIHININNSDIFPNIHTSSPSRQECSTINEECFKQLLYNSPQ